MFTGPVGQQKPVHLHCYNQARQKSGPTQFTKYLPGTAKDGDRQTNLYQFPDEEPEHNGFGSQPSLQTCHSPHQRSIRQHNRHSAVSSRKSHGCTLPNQTQNQRRDQTR